MPSPRRVLRRAIVVFVKFPEPGRVKTRLAAGLGAEAAASIYGSMVAHVFAHLPDDVEVIACYDPAERREEIERWLGGLAKGKALRFLAQTKGDLGARLERAFADAFALGFDRVATIGTDCLEIDAAIFRETWAALGEHDVVLGPSEDGGYYLIALSERHPSLFHGISWSSEHVLAQSRARAEMEKLSVHLLPVRYDVDSEDDWRRAREQLESPRSGPSF